MPGCAYFFIFFLRYFFLCYLHHHLCLPSLSSYSSFVIFCLCHIRLLPSSSSSLSSSSSIFVVFIFHFNLILMHNQTQSMAEVEVWPLTSDAGMCGLTPGASGARGAGNHVSPWGPQPCRPARPLLFTLPQSWGLCAGRWGSSLPHFFLPQPSGTRT